MLLSQWACVHRDEVGLQCAISVKPNIVTERELGVAVTFALSPVRYKLPIQTSLMDS